MNIDLSVKNNLFIGTNYEPCCQMTQKKRTRTPARIAAEKKYAKKQKGRPRLPSGMLTDAENKFCNKVYLRFGKTKKEAILTGLKLLYEKIK